MATRYWLIELRKERTQQEVASLSGISQNYYSWIESGKRTPRPEIAKKMAAVLGFDWTKFYEVVQSTNQAAN